MSKKEKHASDCHPPLIIGGIMAKCTLHPDATSGSMHMKFADMCPSIMDGKKKIGELGGGIGLSIELHDESLPGLVFTIYPKEIWNAYQIALEKSCLKKKASLLK